MSTATPDLDARESRLCADCLFLRRCAVERTVQVCVFCRGFATAAQFSFREVFGVVAIVLLIAPLLMAFVPSQERRSRLAAACCTAAAGFTVMALQILLLLGSSLFMATSLPRAFDSYRPVHGRSCAGKLACHAAHRPFGSISSPRDDGRLRCCLAVSGPVLLFAISQLGDRPGTAAAWAAAQLFFPTLAALSGMLGGYQFCDCGPDLRSRGRRPARAWRALCDRSC